LLITVIYLKSIINLLLILLFILAENLINKFFTIIYLYFFKDANSIIIKLTINLYIISTSIMTNIQFLCENCQNNILKY